MQLSLQTGNTPTLCCIGNKVARIPQVSFPTKFNITKNKHINKSFKHFSIKNRRKKIVKTVSLYRSREKTLKNETASLYPAFLA